MKSSAPAWQLCEQRCMHNQLVFVHYLLTFRANGFRLLFHKCHLLIGADEILVSHLFHF